MLRSAVFLAIMATALLGVMGCDGGTEPAPTGEVRGMVVVEGDGLPGVIVELSGGERREVSTDPSGRFNFTDVPVGAWVVSIRGFPADASFGVTSKPAVISQEAGRRTVTVDFSGNFIRTSSISGRILSGSRPLQGVGVRLEGPDTVDASTDAEGEYAVSGLRRGSYAVELFDLPGSVSFPSTRMEVELEAGESAVVDFEGEPDVTATVHISALRRRLPSGDLEAVDPENVRGRVEVVATVDWADDTPEAVSLMLGEELVGEQRFSSGGAPVSGDADPGARVSLETDPATAPFDLVFAVDTDEFDAETGEVRFLNGQLPLQVRLSTREAGEAAATAELSVTLSNSDRFVGELLPERGPVAGGDGQGWIGGEMGVRVTPVLFNPGREVGTVTLELRRTDGAALRERSVGGTPPFALVFPGRGDPGPTNVAGYQTPAGETDELRVRSARYEDGTELPAMPVVLATGIRIDNVPPPAGIFRLPRQGADDGCCLGNWIGSGFSFAEAFSSGEDAGVGGESATFHVGGASLSDQEIAARSAVSTGADLSPTVANTEYAAVAVVTDALGNRRNVRMEPSDGNSFSNTLGAVFGVDLEPPEVRFHSESLRDRQVNPPSGSEWTVRAEDLLSGFSALPARTTVRLLAPGVDGAEACPFPGTEECRTAPDGLSRDLPESGDGYFVFTTRVLDRGGNRSAELRASVLRDDSAPHLEELERPDILRAGEEAAFRALLSDNVDLHRARLFFRFSSVGGLFTEELAFAPPDTVGGRFDGSPVGAATAEWQSPVVAALERADAGGETGGNEPSGTLREASRLGISVRDAAGNQDGLDEAVSVADASPRSFSVSARGAEEGVAAWELEAAGSQVCAPRSDLEDGGSCAAAPETLDLEATARGEGGAFQPPFREVHYYARVDGAIRWLGAVFAEELADDGSGAEGRAWRWTLQWRPESDLPEGTHALFAVGLDADGNALQSVDLFGIQVVGAS